jgi:hypothetical protein
MSHRPDMECSKSGGIVVGWLHPDQPFNKGQVPQEFLIRLKEFARRWFDSVETLGWGVQMGYHTCEFCGKAMGSGTFGVPSGDRLFYAPELIAHYVEHHQYAPPDEFITSVLACPLPGTPEYIAAVLPFTESYP